MASSAAASDVTDGPVLTVVNKRIRNLRKKLNRISQLEESIAQGKTIIKNKEQEDLLKSKPAITATVDDLEKLRQPLSVAVDEEINLAIQRRHVETTISNGDNGDCDEGKTLGDEQQEMEDLLNLIYFGSMFDVKSQSDFSSIMLTRTHERNCCLTYDYVTDDDTDVMLAERDLDLISMMSSLLITRSVDSSLSHQNALQRCIEHAKLWISKSEQQIDSDSNVTYAALRDKLTKIMRSDFFKITPEMKATADMAAEAAGNYSFQVPVQVEGSTHHYEQKEDVTELHRTETDEDQSSPVEIPHKQDEAEAKNCVEIPVQAEPVEGNVEHKEQHVPQRSFQNQRGGGGRNSGGGRRGYYPNGRGGRSGGRGGPYQNGRNQYYEQSRDYYPRNYYGSRGRGGGGNGGNASNHNPASGAQVAES